MAALAFSDPTLGPPDQLLVCVLEDVLAEWALASAVVVGKPLEGPLALSLEMRLAFFGEREGRLVLRSTAALGRRLAEYVVGETGTDDDAAQDALGELCNLVGKHLASRTLSEEGARIQSSVPESSNPQDWPAVDPAQSVALLVEGEPFEARVWMWMPVRLRERES